MAIASYRLDYTGGSFQIRPQPRMNPRLLLAALSIACLLPSIRAEEKSEPKQASEQEIRARLAEHARKKLTHAVADAPATPATTAETAQSGEKTSTVPAGAATATPAQAGNTVAATPPAPVQEPAAVLPQVDVKKSRITELDRQLGKKNEEIAREKKNTKPTQLDQTLNGPKVSTALALFGGQSSDDRANIAKERVAMMEDEKSLMEAIAQTTDKTEKEELQKTLDGLKAMRRELETALR